MVVQPSIEAYDALMKRVKALEEENKRLRNEKKDTGRSPAEVELKDPKTRVRKASRKSWVDIYNENTTLHKHKVLLGQEIETDEWLEWRVKWGQRGAGMSGLLGVICFVAEQWNATAVFGVLVLIFFGILYYKNFSFVIAKRLLRETNVVVICVLALCNWVIDIARPHSSITPILGLVYMLVVSGFIFQDAVKVKSRIFVIVIGILFGLLTIQSIYPRIFGDWDQGLVLLTYTVQGNKYTFMKRSVKRSIFIQIMLFSMNGVYTLFKDRKQELMIFATGNIYRVTGTASKDVEQKTFVRKIELERKSLSKKIKSEVVRNGKKETSRPPAEVELKDCKTRDRKASRNSWVDIYNENTTLHKHKMLLGQEVETDDGLEWRVKWGQRGAGMSFLLTVICFVAGQWFATAVVTALAFIFVGVLYHKNVSFVISKRLLRETNVVMILVLGLCNLSIDIARPSISFSPILGFLYTLGVSLFVFLDAVKVKSRVFAIVIGIIFVLINLSEIYDRIFGGWDQGIVLLEYTIEGNKYTFMKRSIKRSIYIQIMLFSMNGIYTLLKDRKQELMIFATGPIYRETGTASKDFEDKQYSEKIKSEKRILSV
eukprot:g32.t1